jgi:hypothetical protein
MQIKTKIDAIGGTGTPTGRQIKNTKNGRSWLARFEAPKFTFFVFPFSYISDPTNPAGCFVG